MRPKLPDPIRLNLQTRLTMLQSVRSPTAEHLWQQIDALRLLDRFDEALDLLEAIPDATADPGQRLVHAELLLGLDDPARTDQAAQILANMLRNELPTALRVRALTKLSNIRRDARDLDAARVLLLEALELDPTNAAAVRKYAVVEADTGRMHELLAKCRVMIAAGDCSPRLTATYVTALAAAGDVEEARKVRGAEDLLWSGQLPCPEGHGDISTFNAALLDELQAHPSLRYENSRRASVDSWRVDELYMANSRVVKALLETIAGCVEHYIQDVVDAPGRASDTLFDAVRPEAAQFDSWAVLTNADGYEDWHIHGSGWISGVYYVAVPDGLPRQNSKGGMDRAGAIAFGWAERLLGEGTSAELGEQLFHPEEGQLILFPSHLHHRTWPHGLDDQRIAVSFDVVPV